jgi:GNAT superfamily N-acetyltransferase
MPVTTGWGGKGVTETTGGLPYDLCGFRHGNYRLLPMNPDWAARFGDRLARIDPWLKLGYTPEALCRYFAAAGPVRHAIAVLAGETPAACLTVRPDWLRGPLLEVLAVLPEYQGCGLGRAIVDWLIGETRRERGGNLWTVSSEFNRPAREFYRLQGFEPAGTLPDLIRTGETEMLLRLRLNRR